MRRLSMMWVCAAVVAVLTSIAVTETRDVGAAIAVRAADVGPVSPARFEKESGGPVPLRHNCRKDYSSGNGSTFFAWCISANGTIGELISPADTPNVFAEGFTICSDAGVHAYTFGIDDTSGLRPPTYPSANRVRHVTTDSKFRLEQQLTQDASNKSIFVTVKLTKLGPGTLTNVRFSRAIDFDLGGTDSDDIWVKSYASVIATDVQAASYTGTTWTYPRTSSVEQTFDQWWTTCDASPVVTPATGDHLGRVVYDLGSMAANASRTFVYRIAQL